MHKETYYTCQTCDSFVACLSCIKCPKHRLFSHSSDHFFTPDKPYSNNHWTNRNLSITCCLCKVTNFSGQRYQCRQCINYNICSNCLDHAKRTHCKTEKHILDFIPNSTKIRLNRYLLAQRTIQILDYRNANDFERDPITGWTIKDAKNISEQTLELCSLAWNDALDLLKEENIELSSPNIIENEKIKKIFVTITMN